MELPPPVARELDELARAYGPPITTTVEIDDSFTDPIAKPDRYGEVCMVVRRKNGRILLAIKTFYPRGAFRLPTGGIHHGEGVHEALVREAHEETGLDLRVERFLARIAYRRRGLRAGPPVFHTFAFLLTEVGGTLGTLDAGEELEDWKEIDASELPAVADRLAHLTSSGARDIGGDWRAWGRFRAVVHRVVHEALAAG